MLREAVNNRSNSSSFWRVAGYTLSSIAQTDTGLHTLAAVLTRVALAISASKDMASCTQGQSQDAVITSLQVNFSLSETLSLFSSRGSIISRLRKTLEIFMRHKKDNAEIKLDLWLIKCH